MTDGLLTPPRLHVLVVDPDAGSVAGLRRALLVVEHDTVDSDPAAIQYIAVDADRIGAEMLERECSQEAAQPDGGVVRTCVDRFAGGRARLSASASSSGRIGLAT